MTNTPTMFRYRDQVTVKGKQTNNVQIQRLGHSKKTNTPTMFRYRDQGHSKRTNTPTMFRYRDQVTVKGKQTNNVQIKRFGHSKSQTNQQCLDTQIRSQ